MARSRQSEEEFTPDEAFYDGPSPTTAGGWIGGVSWILALAWIASCAVFAYAALGLVGLQTLSPVILGAGAGVVVTVAALIVFAGAAAREGARGRAQAGLVAYAAQRMLSPSPGAEAAARRLGVSVRGEIAALDRALDQTLQKVREVEGVIARQTLAVDHAASAAQAGARHMVSGLERERAELLQIADDLANQAGLIGDALGRHTRLISDAARMAEQEVRSADEALDARLSSFGAAAALISDRTNALIGAAKASADSALRLEMALSTALDTLAKATSLTDAARQSAESAAEAASSTAGAVRETTSRAVDEARRAAEYIRQEAASVQHAGETAIQRLRDAASQARQSVSAIAPDPRMEPRPAPRPEPARMDAPQRPQPAPQSAPRPQYDPLGGDAHVRPTPRPEPRPEQRPEPRPEPRIEPRRADPAQERTAARQSGFAERLSGIARPTPQPAPQPAPQAAPQPAPRAPAQDPNAWTWRDVLAAIDQDQRESEPPALNRAAPPAPEPPPRSPAPSMRDPRPEAARRAPPMDAAQEPGAAFAANTGRPRPQGADPSLWGGGSGGDDLDRRVSEIRGKGPVGWGMTFSPGAGARSNTASRADDDGRSDARPSPATPGPEKALLAAAGVHPGEVFNDFAIERIARKARAGTQSRRRAVRETAPEAVLRLAEHLDQDPEARARAAAFLKGEGARIADLLSRGRAALSTDVTRAFLLIDAAAA
jgi:hypothetical protein